MAAWRFGKRAKNRPEPVLRETQPADARDELMALTPREREVFARLCAGAKLKDIAYALGIQFSTVNTHQKSIYKKLGVNTRAECIIRYGK